MDDGSDRYGKNLLVFEVERGGGFFRSISRFSVYVRLLGLEADLS